MEPLYRERLITRAPPNVRAFRAIVVIKNDIALVTDRNLLSRFSLKPERESIVIALVILRGDGNVGFFFFLDKRTR